MSKTDKKNLVIFLFMMAFFFALTFSLVSLYYKGITVLTARILQAGYYLLMAGLSLLMMKISDYRFKDFGVFFFHLLWQVLIGICVAAALTIMGVFATGGYTLPTDWLYLVPSQSLVGIAEELFWRGLLLKLLSEMLHSKHWAIPVNAILFGIWHYPLTQSIASVFILTFIGIVFAALRNELDDRMGIPGLAVAHALMNVF